MSHQSAFTFLNNANQPETLHVMGHKMLVRLCVADTTRMLIDAPATFRYAELSIDGIPLRPQLLGVRNYE